MSCSVYLHTNKDDDLDMTIDSLKGSFVTVGIFIGHPFPAVTLAVLEEVSKSNIIRGIVRIVRNHKK